MKKVAAAVIVVLLAGALAGCAYKPLKAPCGPDEGGTPLAYSQAPRTRVPEAFQSLDHCGPMRPI